MHAAVDLLHQREVALKLDADGALLRREFSALWPLRHPSLPAVHDFGFEGEGGGAYLALELLEGVPLGQLAGLEAEGARRLFSQAARTLQFLNARGLVHGDVKPDNIWIGGGAGGARHLKLIDLGLAVGVVGTAPGVVRGTPRYAAPSILAGEPPSLATDLFALGASFFEALCGAIPGRDGAAGDAAAARLPRDLRQVLLRSIEQHEDARYQSVEDLLHDLWRTTPAGAATEAQLAEPKLVGRDRELEQLRAWLEAWSGPEGGGPRLVLDAEPGGGGSRLLHALRGMGLLAGAAVLELPGSEAERGAWLQRLEDLRTPTPGSPQKLLFLADGVGLEALRRLSARLEAFEGAGLVVRPAACTGEQRPGAAELEARGWQRLGLERLSRPETRALLASVPGFPAAPEVGARVAELVEGHAGFASAAAHAVARSAVTPLSLDRVVFEAAPEALVEGWRRVLAERRPREEALLSALCLQARPLPRELLRRLAKPAVPDGGLLDELLGGLQARGWVERTEIDGGASFAIASDPLRRLFLEGLEVRERRALHLRAARAWRAHASGGLADEECLAHHFVEGGDSGRGLAHVLRVARAHLGLRDPARALAWCRELEQAFPEAAGQSGDLRELLGDAHHQRGEGLAALAEYEVAFDRAREERAAPEPRVRLGRKLAVALEASGQTRRAYEVLTEALSLAGERTPAVEVAGIFELLGQVQYRLGRPEAARRSLEEGFSVLENPLRDWSAASLWNNLGLLAFERGEFALAAEHHRKALFIRDLHQDEEGRARSLGNLANVAIVTGRLEEARARYEDSLGILRRLESHSMAANHLTNLALIDHWTGNHASALRRHEEALRLRESLADHHGRISTLCNLAELWTDKGNLGEARRRATAALGLADAGEKRDNGLAEALCALGRVELGLGRVDAARSLVQRGLAVTLELGNRSTEALLRRLLAQVHCWSEPPAEVSARGELDKAEAILRETGELRYLAEILLVRAELDLLGTAGEGSEVAAREARELARRLGAPSMEARAELILGRLAGQAGRVGEASNRLHRAEALASRLAAPELHWRACEALAAFHRQCGRPTRALGWLKRCVGIFRSVMRSLDDSELEANYLEHPARRALLARLGAWVGMQAGEGERSGGGRSPVEAGRDKVEPRSRGESSTSAQSPSEPRRDNEG